VGELHQSPRETPSSPKQPAKTKTADATPPRADVEQICARLFRWLIMKDYRQRPASISDAWHEAAREPLNLDQIPLQEPMCRGCFNVLLRRWA
jgi:hypothetical protein